MCWGGSSHLVKGDEWTKVSLQEAGYHLLAATAPSSARHLWSPCALQRAVLQPRDRLGHEWPGEPVRAAGLVPPSGLPTLLSTAAGAGGACSVEAEGQGSVVLLVGLASSSVWRAAHPRLH